ncbi:hypothetical protein ACRB68_51480 [Actinomadura sp. RB68]|uniref:Mycothiol-dependent maleylpyruvate isomerase metal-binding domain-containing protein n=2 Tax=Actinomadura macrotermitis TaxID=2585200 RepID=A0A7K0C0R1_9ACTN|nr:hypothetical protein [Actinomadura macrotermitis]
MTEFAAECARIARGVPAGPLEGPSPCGDFDARTLVNHWVLFTSHGLERRARRETLPEEMMEHDFTAEPDWAERYAEQLDRAVKAWGDPAAWEGEIDLGSMSVPASGIAGMVVLEMGLHGWDVATMTGQEFTVSDEAARYLLGLVEENAEMYRQFDGFAEPAQVDEGADAFRRAVALSGRDPR